MDGFAAGVDRSKAAFLDAKAAVITLVKINNGKVPLHADSLPGTGPDASLAAGASNFAGPGNCFPPILRAAPNQVPVITFRDQADDAAGTGIAAEAAAGASGLVNLRQPAGAHGDSLKRAGPHAVPQSQTAVRAGLEPAMVLLSIGAVGNPVINKYFAGAPAVTAAENSGHHRNHRSRLLAHDGGNSLGSGVSTGDAAINRGLPLNNGFCIFVASGVRTGAAVGSGQRLADRFHAGIRIYGEKMGRGPEKYAQ